MNEKRVHLISQFRVAGTLLVEQRGRLPRRQIARCQEDSLDLLVGSGVMPCRCC